MQWEHLLVAGEHLLLRTRYFSTERRSHTARRARMLCETLRQLSVPYSLPFLPIGMPCNLIAAAQPGIAADRFARAIVHILKAFPARSRQLNANPLGRT